MQRLRHVGGLGSVRARQQGAECPLAFCAILEWEKMLLLFVLEGGFTHLSHFPALLQTERDTRPRHNRVDNACCDAGAGAVTRSSERV